MSRTRPIPFPAGISSCRHAGSFSSAGVDMSNGLSDRLVSDHGFASDSNSRGGNDPLLRTR